MAMSSRQRWALIIAALLATLAAMAWLETNEENTAENAELQPKTIVSRALQASPQKSRSAALGADDLGMPAATGSDPTSRGVRQDTSPAESTVLPDLSQRKQTLAADDDQHVDLFKAHAWYVPPPPPKPTIQPENLPPPKPVAPPLPYTYMGKLEDGPQGSLIFLVLREKVVQAKLGQTLDRVWKLEREDANALYFTYLPLSMPKTLAKTTKSAPTAGATSLNRMPAVVPVPAMPDGNAASTDAMPSEPPPLIPTN